MRFGVIYYFLVPIQNIYVDQLCLRTIDDGQVRHYRGRVNHFSMSTHTEMD